MKKQLVRANAGENPKNQLQFVNPDPDAEYRGRLDKFIKALQKEPNPAEIGRTPDGKAKTIPISYIETTLDEFFLGLWETEKFQWNVIANEVVGSIELVVTHPISGEKLRRTGAASIQIMVDKGADAMDITRKKANALDMGFPKLKAECLKNAAQSLGKLFGRDLNRQQVDTYKSMVKPEKRELNPQAKEWSDAITALASGNITVDQIKEHFRITLDSLELLEQEVEQAKAKQLAEENA